MPSILVVEHEGRYIERIQDALSSEGWHPRFVAGRPEALRAAASEAPNLVLVNADLPGAAELLRSFARSQGGPGAVALLGEAGGGEGLEADELLTKPFSDQELRLVVRRRLAATGKGPSPPSPPVATVADDHKLTSQEIFGDLLAEVEEEVAAGGGDTGAGAAVVRPTGGGDRPRDEDVERRLERTLSGVPGMEKRRRAAAPPPPGESTPPVEEPPEGPGDGEPGREEPPPQAPPPPPRRDPDPDRPPQNDPPARRAGRSVRPADDDVDELLNMTLSGLRLESRGRTAKSPAEKVPRTARPSVPEIDLSELEALAGRGRRRQGAAGATTTPAAASEKAAASVPATSLPATTPPSDEVPAPPSASPSPPAAASDETRLEAAARSTPVPGPVDDGDGRRFGHYRLLERIAVGGMAEVWKARMSGVEGFQKTVAIKRILPHMNDDSDFVDMFIDEAKLAAQLNHPNITHIYDLGKIGDDYYIAMEYVDGRNLRAILNESRRKALRLPVGFALLVAARLASALDYAHRKRDFDERDLELVHRDVSPQNVLISTDGSIKLCDFGISKAVAKLNQTETGALKGKLQYMSPEQAWGRPVDARSDLFSLGALTFEMLTGERLFTGDSEISVLEAVRECRVRRPSQVEPAVPAAVEAVVVKALERDPADRYANAGEMLQALEAVLYDLRPTPSQADVAAFLARLEAAPEVRPGMLATASGTGTGSTPADAATPDRPLPPSAAGVPKPEERMAAGAEATGTGTGPDPATGGTGTGTGRGGRVEEEAGGGGWPAAAAGGDAPAVKSDQPGPPTESEVGEGAGPPPVTDADSGVGDRSTAGERSRTAAAAAIGREDGRRWWRFGSPPPAPPAAAASAAVTTTQPLGEESAATATATAEGGRGPATHGAGQGVGPLDGSPGPPSDGARRPTLTVPDAPGPPAPDASPTRSADPDATATRAPMPAERPAIVAAEEVDEEASRGRWMLIVMILLLAVVAVATWLWLDRPARSEPDGTAPSAEEPLEVAPVATPEASPEAPAEPEIDLERLVEEELARQEEVVRRKAEEDYRETARRIQAEIDALNRRQAAPAPPPADDPPPPQGDQVSPPQPGPPGGLAAAGDDGSAKGDDATPPRLAGLGPGGPARVVTSGEAQYPAGVRGPWFGRPTAPAVLRG